jgi:hypothetical protein
MGQDSKPLPRRSVRPKRAPPDRRAAAVKRTMPPVKRESRPPAPSEFGTGVLVEAEADAAHGDYLWSSVRGKVSLVVSAVGYAVYQLFASN